LDYAWPGNIRELENLVKRYVIVGNEAQIIRELSTHKPIVSSTTGNTPMWGLKEQIAQPATGQSGNGNLPSQNPPPAPINPLNELEAPSLLDIGKRAAMIAEREAIERVLTQTRWNRRQAAKILKVSYKALLNKLKAMEEQNRADNQHKIS
jgi:DNA-binding NtrC family response regulator